MTKQADLLIYLFEGQRNRLSGELMQWMEASSRFTDFVETYRDKIRKKIRVTRDPESALDVRAELEVAYRLLNDRRLALAYEPYASAKTRGPDFSVTYRTNLVFNIEVARLRVEEAGSVEGMAGHPRNGVPSAELRSRDAAGIDLAHKEERIMRILLDKLGQMQPGKANLLVIHIREDLARAIDLSRLMQAVKTRVEGRDPAFYTASHYSGPAAFYKDFLRLSGILLWASAPASLAAPAPLAAPVSPAAPSTTANQLWVNKQARPALDEKILRLVALAK